MLVLPSLSRTPDFIASLQLSSARIMRLGQPAPRSCNDNLTLPNERRKPWIPRPCAGRWQRSASGSSSAGRRPLASSYPGGLSPEEKGRWQLFHVKWGLPHFIVAGKVLPDGPAGGHGKYFLSAIRASLDNVNFNLTQLRSYHLDIFSSSRFGTGQNFPSFTQSAVSLGKLESFLASL